MRAPLIRQGEGPAAAHERMERERRHALAKLERIKRDTAASATTPTTRLARGATAGGDARKLRGIPAIGRSVSGAIPGTAPHQSQITRDNVRQLS